MQVANGYYIMQTGIKRAGGVQVRDLAWLLGMKEEWSRRQLRPFL